MIKSNLQRIFFLFILCSCQAVAGNLPIWEIEGTSNRVLLMGSVHMLRSTDYPLPAGIDAAYDLADELYMEIDMDSIDPMTTQATLMAIGTSGTPLSKKISSEAYATANQKATKAGIPLMLFEQFEPWFAALSITQLRMMQLGFDPAQGIETQMLAKAQRDGKNIYGLETLEQQLGFMDRLDPQAQEDFLLHSLDEVEKIEKTVGAIVAAWRSGDTATMEQLLLADLESQPDLADSLLIQRNRNWISPIVNLMDERNNYLVIVGAMHLIGEDSVIAMLEDRGIEVTQLSSADLR
ncbi:MAG: TraB/GumN family protein [Gammaproteobacteria bacterium]